MIKSIRNIILKNVILMILLASSCTKKHSPSPTQSSSTTKEFIEGKWLITQYQLLGSTSVILKSDTLNFLDVNNYVYNQQQELYYLINMNSFYKVELKDTPWGTIVGNLPLNFRETKQINGVLFSQLVSSPQCYYLWIRKL